MMSTSTPELGPLESFDETFWWLLREGLFVASIVLFWIVAAVGVRIALEVVGPFSNWHRSVHYSGQES
ncbi:hypothetical protein [Natronobacterium gregoryi]|uniref:Uncharacterized protein n=2 Tax=Natronobacterium gregoryi TaxID=44930 RepID=L0AEM2_NATGS|nr:hypothetical protein [Natronobacterium gregoryi]AFZ71582.1 hypothetical protein Natgr_0324 [Natronobacterium gregoryi SP2]SFI81227.1 hypothetical protein SAMN05443661_10661 [Natronobacterium gregoryi]